VKPRRARMVAAFAILMSTIGVCSKASAQVKPASRKPGVMFKGNELPLPPQSGKHWKVPATKLPAPWGTAVQKLLSYGFADPRGCEYREVELTCGTLWWPNKSFLLRTHAWVLPQPVSGKPDAERFAVTWSGLVYPVVTVGEPAGLRADVEAQLKFSQAERIPLFAEPEERLLSHEYPHPLKGCLLLVLGEVDLAEKVWQVAEPYFDASRIKGPANRNDDPYLGLVQNWASAHFDRVASARLRGDDVVSLASARLLLPLRDTVEIDAPKRGFENTLYFEQGQQRPYFLDFLRLIEVIIADQARRVTTKPVVRVLDPGAAPIADSRARIAALIRDLEVVDTPPSIQSFIVKALSQEGLPAVDPLLECLERDERLTRSVSFRNDSFPERDFFAVNKAAFAALQAILKTHTFGPRTHHGFFGLTRPDKKTREAYIKEIRDFYLMTKGGTVDAARWYLTLSNPLSTEKEWLEAAQNITSQHAHSTTIPLNSKAATQPDEPNASHEPRLQGESLRSGLNPSVSELMAKRADKITTFELNNSDRTYHLRNACTLTLCLSKWDMQAALPEIRNRVDQCQTLRLDRKFHFHASALHSSFSHLIIAAVDALAEEFIDPYIAWMTDLKPETVDPILDFEIFQPLSRYADHPKMVDLAKTLFSSKSSWVPLHQRVGFRWHGLLTSPVVGVSAFRELLKSQLDDQTRVGTITLDTVASHVQIQIGDGSMGQSIRTAFDPDEPGLAEPKPVRRCDFIAWTLSQLQGAPLYELWWPEAKRNLVMPQMKKFLDQWGNAFRDQGPVWERFGSAFGQASFHIAKLDRLATMQDVAAGQAIFFSSVSTENGRVVALKTFPQSARWRTLTDFPIQENGLPDLATGEPTRIRSFDRDGSIWQAEEVLVDGQWKRYYGFVGRHIIARVSAEEIEFVE
jgi:hypothetical protein